MAKVNVSITNDSWLDEANTATNHGTDQTLKVGTQADAGRTQRAKYGIFYPSYPNLGSVTVTRARLRIDVNSITGSQGVDLFCNRLVSTGWTEGAVTWSQKTLVAAWAGGGAISGLDYSVVNEATLSLPVLTGLQWLELGKDLGQDLYDNAAAFILRSGVPGSWKNNDFFDMDSSETLVGNPPLLELSYHTPALKRKTRAVSIA